MKKIRLLLALAVLATTPVIAMAQTTLLNDTFSDGSSTDQNLSSSALWLNSSTSGMTLTSGALSVTAGRHALTYFTDSGTHSLTNVGDSLTVSFNIVFSQVGNASGGFRVGLFDSNGAVRPTANGNNSAFTDYNGYAFSMALATPTTSSSTNNNLSLQERNTSVSGALISGLTGGAYTGIGSGGGPTGQTLATATTYTINYSVSRTTASSLTFAFSLTGGTVTGFSNSFTDESPSTYEFDAFAILSTSSNGSSFSIDNVQVTAIPEPSTYAALAGFAALGLCVWQRRRQRQA